PPAPAPPSDTHSSPPGTPATWSVRRVVAFVAVLLQTPTRHCAVPPRSGLSGRQWRGESGAGGAWAAGGEGAVVLRVLRGWVGCGGSRGCPACFVGRVRCRGRLRGGCVRCVQWWGCGL